MIFKEMIIKRSFKSKDGTIRILESKNGHDFNLEFEDYEGIQVCLETFDRYIDAEKCFQAIKNFNNIA